MINFNFIYKVTEFSPKLVIMCNGVIHINYDLNNLKKRNLGRFIVNLWSIVKKKTQLQEYNPFYLKISKHEIFIQPIEKAVKLEKLFWIFKTKYPLSLDLFQYDKFLWIFVSILICYVLRTVDTNENTLMFRKPERTST